MGGALFFYLGRLDPFGIFPSSWPMPPSPSISSYPPAHNVVSDVITTCDFSFLYVDGEE